jgi:hypothetical protein
MAPQLMWSLRTTSGVDLPLRELFVRQTVAGLADAVDALRWTQKSSTSRSDAGVREEIVV